MMFWRPHRVCWSQDETGRSNFSRRSRPRRSIRAASRGKSSKSSCCWATAEIVARATKLFGPIKPATSAELHAQIDRLAGVDSRRFRRAQAGPPDLRPAMSRAAIRSLARGARLGPTSPRTGATIWRTCLLNIVNPSAEIREGYTTSIVAMTDGRVLSGIVVEQDKNVVVLRGSDGKEAALARADIDAIRTSRTSIMPEGLLNELTRPAGARPVCLSSEHTTADRLIVEKYAE